MTSPERQEVYVIFDGPPGHEAGRFVEVETEDGKGVKVEGWKQMGRSRYWRLGPFLVPKEGEADA